MTENKRQSARATLDWPVTVINDTLTTQGTIQNLSCGGALITIPVELFPSEPIRIAIEIPEYEDVISAKAEVVRSFPVKTGNELPSFQVGIRFTEISHEDLKHFTGNLAPEWQDNYMEPPIMKHSGNGLSLKVLCGLLGLLLAGMMFYALRPNSSNQGETRSIKSIESRMQLFEERLLQREPSEIPSQHLEERIQKIEDKLTALENKFTAGTTTEELQAGHEQQEKPSAELAAETKTAPEVQTKNQAHVAPETAPPAYHTVSNGENLYRIGLRYGISVKELLTLNNLPPNASIYHGQKLLVKRGE